MAASGLLRERDLRALTAVVEDGLRDDPGEAMPWAVLDRLQHLIPGSKIGFGEMDVLEQKNFTEQILEDGEPFLDLDNEGNPAYWQLRPSFLPHSYAIRTGDQSSVLRWSDFYTRTEFMNHPFRSYMRAFDSTTRYGIFVPLPAPAGRFRRVSCWRSSRDFTERDRLVLQLLRPHLHEVYLDAERRRRGIPQLSRREVEVLQLASQGHGNADIARILFISPATVAKHMEHIFDRTGARTRSAAAALALPQVSPFTGLPPKTRR